METKVIELYYEEFRGMSELASSDVELLQAAVAAQSKAYATYSHFKVGAAVLLENGTIVTGNNQENAAYPSGLCAERVALFAAAAQYPDQAIVALAITADTRIVEQPISPCGACRQVMLEYECRHAHPMRIIMGNPHSHVLIFSKIKDILPFGFAFNSIKK